jgi:riboflavin biosynthesis pyrimidine reductase
VNIEKYIDIYHDFIFLTSFNHSSSNIYPLLNGEFNLNNIFSELKINSLLVEGGNYLHKFLLNNLKYDSFYWFKSSKKITNGCQLSDPILNKLNSEYKVINKFPLKDNQLTTYTYI